MKYDNDYEFLAIMVGVILIACALGKVGLFLGGAFILWIAAKPDEP